MNLCVLIPTYNNADTLADVIRRTLQWCPNVIVINDGSTDKTAEVLKSFTGQIRTVDYGQNEGKGYALKQGLLAAKAAGFTHALTIDADGQHFPEDIPILIAESQKHPQAIIVGSRNLEVENMPGKNTFANRFSNFWFHLQTGINLPDTQTGFRIYPLQVLSGLKYLTRRYEAELLLLVLNAWKGIELVPVKVNVFYPSKEERVSHFHPIKDFARISVLNTILTFLSVFCRKRILFIAIAVLCAILSVIGIRHLQMEEDIARFLPSEPLSDRYTDVYRKMAGQNRGVIIVGKEETDTSPCSITDLMDEMGNWISQIDTAHVIQNLQVYVDEGTALESSAFMHENAPYFLEEEDYARMDSLFARKDFVSQQIKEAKELVGLPTGSIFARTLPYDPLSIFNGPTLRFQKQNTTTGSLTLNNGYLLSADESHGLILFNSPYGMSESAGNRLIAQIIDSAADSLKSHYPSAEVCASGAPVIAASNADQIKKDCILAVSLAIILILGVLLYAFRSIKSLILMAVALGFGWLTALGCMSLFKDHVSIIVLGIGSVVIGIAANYPLHFLHHLKHEANRKLALRELAPPLIVGNITTVSAFACLCFLDAEAMRDLGLFASLMLIATILFVIFVLPGMPSNMLPHPSNITEDDSNKKIIPWRFPTLSRKWQSLLLLFFVSTIILTMLSFNTSFDANMQHINYMTAEQREGLAILSGANSHNKPAQDDSYTDIYIARDAKTEQCHKIQRWNDFWKRHQDVIPQLRSAASAQGFSEDAFEPFVHCITNNYEVQDSTFFAPFLKSAIGSQILQMGDDHTLRYISQKKVKTSEADSIKSLIANEIAPHGGFVFDSSDVSNRLVNLMSDNFNFIGWVCSIVVFVFLWLSLGRIELSLLSFLPLAVAWVWILGIMNITYVQFNIVNIILATFIFGQGDDYTIFITEGLMFEYAYGKPRLNTYKKSIILSAIIMFIGIGVLILAKHPALKSLAQVAIIGMTIVVIMACWLPPMIYRWLTTAQGKLREIPITLPRLLRSLFALTWTLVWMICLMKPLCFVISLIDRKGKKMRGFLHYTTWKFAKFSCQHIPGVRSTFINSHGEDFKKPAVIVCNHQSHLEILHILSLSPKIVIMTNNWVWRNPIYGKIIHRLEFYPAEQGVNGCIERMKELMNLGYSIAVFPEGTRSPQCQILRFHQGALKMASELNIDVLPLYLHGAGHVLPKYDFMLRKGHICLEVGQRLHINPDTAENELLALTQNLRQQYRIQYARMQQEHEDFSYWSDFVYHKYIYKGLSIAHNASSHIRRAMAYEHEWKERLKYSSMSAITVDSSDNGELAWLLAKCYPHINFHAKMTNQDALTIALATSAIPNNLQFSL